MNDNMIQNDLLYYQQQKEDDDIETKINIQLQRLAIRAVTKPESLTTGEIQDVAWAFLMNLCRKR